MPGRAASTGTPNPDVAGRPPKEAAEALGQVEADKSRLRVGDFTLTEDVSGERTLIAEYQPDIALAIRGQKPARVVFVTVEEFQVDGTADNTETFNLANNIVDTPATEPLALFDDGSRVQEDSIDFANDSFDYTSANTNTYIHAFYVVRDPVQVQIEKVSPDTQGSVSEILFDENTGILHDRDQNQEPPHIQTPTPLGNVVPPDWKLQVYADGSPALSWDDSDEANSNNVSAPNPLLSIPINRARHPVPGIGKAVRRDILDRPVQG